IRSWMRSPCMRRRSRPRARPCNSFIATPLRTTVSMESYFPPCRRWRSLPIQTPAIWRISPCTFRTPIPAAMPASPVFRSRLHWAKPAHCLLAWNWTGRPAAIAGCCRSASPWKSCSEEFRRQPDSSEMKIVNPQKLEIAVGKAATVSALLIRPAEARACFVFAHGAGAGMTHSFMEKVAAGLGERGVATLRYQFPYMERASRRPDPPALAHAAVRATVAEAGRCCPGLRLIAGGKSFGGRMTSQAQALKPSTDRAKHLSDVRIPMLFVQGNRDNLADMKLLEPVVKGLGPSASLHLIAEADHSFHVPARSGRNDDAVMHDILDTFAGWIEAIETS